MNSFYRSIPIFPTSELAPLYKTQLSNTLFINNRILQFHVFYEFLYLSVDSIVQFELSLIYKSITLMVPKSIGLVTMSL